MWNCIEFIDGSNPYICKTEKDFSRMKRHYILQSTSENRYWKATHKITYAVIGYSDNLKVNTYRKEYRTKQGALRVISALINDRKYDHIVLREEKKYLGSIGKLEYSSTEIIKTWDLAENYR